jgi:hypothetical protein
MPETVVKALNLDKSGNSLAVWLASHHPDLFLAAFKQAQAQRLATKAKLQGLRGLADDGITSTFDTEPTLQTITVNTDFDTSNISNMLSDATPSGSSFLDSVGSGFTSAGSTIGGALANAGSSVLGALGSVGSYLGSATGINMLGSIVKSYYSAQAATSNAQTQQAVLQAQIGRAAAGRSAAPITYTIGANGLPVPVYATQTAQGTVYQPLSAQGIQSLTPSALSQFFGKYGLYIGLGGAALWAVSMAMRR